VVAVVAAITQARYQQVGEPLAARYVRATGNLPASPLHKYQKPNSPAKTSRNLSNVIIIFY